MSPLTEVMVSRKEWIANDDTYPFGSSEWIAEWVFFNIDMVQFVTVHWLPFPSIGAVVVAKVAAPVKPWMQECYSNALRERCGLQVCVTLCLLETSESGMR